MHVSKADASATETSSGVMDEVIYNAATVDTSMPRVGGDSDSSISNGADSEGKCSPLDCLDTVLSDGQGVKSEEEIHKLMQEEEEEEEELGMRWGKWHGRWGDGWVLEEFDSRTLGRRNFLPNAPPFLLLLPPNHLLAPCIPFHFSNLDHHASYAMPCYAMPRASPRSAARS
ncbi:unnamed protein product [Taenia asiatica]|uniref:Uncharacterized protein n=1 Tax=Taenia asiatica TaxID=60517 RepID=A0A0R3VY96_TAEAS|nr:unnamed protein product [Taenia asiatica]